MKQRNPSVAVSMIPSNVKVFLASHPIDFRRGPDMAHIAISIIAVVFEMAQRSWSMCEENRAKDCHRRRKSSEIPWGCGQAAAE
jgi:hypothetical protein